tara:strand:- start:23105 stop:23617 length:513 start_codon:yes stop_codon:yes gene_type:complete
MADEQNTTPETEATESTGRATVPEINSIEELGAYVAELEANETEGPSARGYTINGGLRAVSPLYSLSPNVLLSMAGCINTALATHISEGTEGAQEALDLSMAHAQNAVTVTRHTAQFNKFLDMAIDLGYAPDGANTEALTHEQQVATVDAFLASQKGKVNSWAAWQKANA